MIHRSLLIPGIVLLALWAVPAVCAPVIRAGGVVNAASFRPAEFSGGGLAQGALATAFGTGLGPGTEVSATVYPLASTLAGVGVRLTQGANSVNAYPVFVVAGQVNFLVPSNTPLGPTEVRVTYNNETSTPLTVQIVKSAFGLFTFTQGTSRAVAQNFVSGAETPVNLPTLPAKPGQTLIAYGTGLGPIAGADNVAAPAGDIAGAQVEILVGGVQARRLYAGRSPCCSGLDQIIFELPNNAPAGCTVPLVVRVDGVYSNLGDISISSDGSQCTDPAGGGGTKFCREGTYGWLHLGEVFRKPPHSLHPTCCEKSVINLFSAPVSASFRVCGSADHWDRLMHCLTSDRDPLTTATDAASAAGNVQLSGCWARVNPAKPHAEKRY